MPDNDLIRRSLDLGLAVTQLTRQRAEKLVRDLVRQGEISRDQATTRVEELLERSRQNSEALLAVVRKEIDDRLAQLNVVTRDDLMAFASRIGIQLPVPRGGVKKAATKAAKATAPATKAAKKATAPAKKAAKKATAPAKKAAKKATAPAKKAAKKAAKAPASGAPPASSSTIVSASASVPGTGASASPPPPVSTSISSAPMTSPPAPPTAPAPDSLFGDTGDSPSSLT